MWPDRYYELTKLWKASKRRYEEKATKAFSNKLKYQRDRYQSTFQSQYGLNPTPGPSKYFHDEKRTQKLTQTDKYQFSHYPGRGSISFHTTGYQTPSRPSTSPEYNCHIYSSGYEPHSLHIYRTGSEGKHNDNKRRSALRLIFEYYNKHETFSRSVAED